MEVHVESECADSSLHSGDGACVGVGNAWEVENGFGSFAERTVELVREGTHDQRREDAVIAEQRTQAPGQGANPVTHGYARQHVLLHVVSAMRRPRQEGQKPRRFQERATRCEWPQLRHTRCTLPADKSPQRKYSSNSRTTNFGRPPCCSGKEPSTFLDMMGRPPRFTSFVEATQ